MSSTTNRNSPGNYNMEQYSMQQNRDYRDYVGYGSNETTYFAGDGLLSGKMTHRELSHNGNDIESFLFGINSTNLVTASQPITPNIRKLKSLSIIDKTPIILPEPFKVTENQRPNIMT